LKRCLGEIVVEEADDGLRAGDEPGRVDAEVEVVGHVGHLAVAIGSEPVVEVPRFLLHVSRAGDAGAHEAVPLRRGLEPLRALGREPVVGVRVH
jgi:hypothetical protein